MGSVRLTYSDIKIPRGLFATPLVYDVDPLSATSYMPFGEQIPDLSFEKSAYAHGYTSHLKDNDVRPEKGKGANYSTLFREYDPLIGRWWSADPKRSLTPGESPYAGMGNNPINNVDILGDYIYSFKNTYNSQIKNDLEAQFATTGACPHLMVSITEADRNNNLYSRVSISKKDGIENNQLTNTERKLIEISSSENSNVTLFAMIGATHYQTDNEPDKLIGLESFLAFNQHINIKDVVMVCDFTGINRAVRNDVFKKGEITLHAILEGGIAALNGYSERNPAHNEAIGLLPLTNNNQPVVTIEQKNGQSYQIWGMARANTTEPLIEIVASPLHQSHLTLPSIDEIFIHMNQFRSNTPTQTPETTTQTNGGRNE